MKLTTTTKAEVEGYLGEALVHFAVVGKVDIIENDVPRGDVVLGKSVLYKRAAIEVSAPLVFVELDVQQASGAHDFRKLVRHRLGKALHHLIQHGANLKAPAPEASEADAVFETATGDDGVTSVTKEPPPVVLPKAPAKKTARKAPKKAPAKKGTK